MEKIKKTLKTLRGKVAIVLILCAVGYGVYVFGDPELPAEQKLAPILAVAVLCLIPAVLAWVTGWKFANTPFSVKWAKWDGKHELPNQQKRMRKAIQPMFDTIFFDKYYGCAKYRELKNGNVYHTNLYNCLCSDYQKRHLPCCHMYALAGELGLIDLYQALPPKKEAPAAAKEASSEE